MGEVRKMELLNDLRFIERDGKQVLQQLCRKQDFRYCICFSEWDDVPTIREE